MALWPSPCTATTIVDPKAGAVCSEDIAVAPYGLLASRHPNLAPGNRGMNQSGIHRQDWQPLLHGTRIHPRKLYATLHTRASLWT